MKYVSSMASSCSTTANSPALDPAASSAGPGYRAATRIKCRHEDRTHRNARLPRPDAELGVRQSRSPTRTGCSAGARRRSNGTRGPSSARSKICAELVVGEDPTRIEHLWQMMFRQHFWHGHGIVRATAIAGIDLALWDILGKVAGCRAASCGAGRCAITIRTYCHLGGGRMEDFYETAAEDAKRFADLARQAVADGFTAFKSMAVPPTMPIEGLKPIRAAEACVAAMREAVGDDDRHHGRLPRPAVAGDGAEVRQGAGAVWPLLPRGAVLAGKRRRPGRDQRRGQHADRDRRAGDEPRRVSRPVRRAGLRNLPARHHALRRLHRSAAHRRPGRGLSHRPGPAQSARAGQHGRVAGVRLLAAELHHLRDGPRRRALAAGRRRRKASPSSRKGASCGPTRGPAWASRSTKPK